MDINGVSRVRFGSFVHIQQEDIVHEMETEVLVLHDRGEEVSQDPPPAKIMKSEIVFDSCVADGYPFHSCLATGSDGASLMLGRHSGVMSSIATVQPYCKSIHCPRHRMHLVASTDVQRGTGSIPKLMSLMNRSYWWWKARPQMCMKQKRLAALLVTVHLSTSSGIVRRDGCTMVYGARHL